MIEFYLWDIDLNESKLLQEPEFDPHSLFGHVKIIGNSYF